MSDEEQTVISTPMPQGVTPTPQQGQKGATEATSTPTVGTFSQATVATHEVTPTPQGTRAVPIPEGLGPRVRDTGSPPEVTPTPQSPTPIERSYTTLSRVEEHDLLESLTITVGTKLLLVWRVAPTLESEVGEWLVSEVTVLEEERDPSTGRLKFTTCLQWEGEELMGTLPLQIGFEVAAISRVKRSAPNIKELLRKRTRSSTETDFIHGQDQATVPAMRGPIQNKEHVGHHFIQAQSGAIQGQDHVPVPAMRGLVQNRSAVEDAVFMSHALADVKRGRSTVELLNGDGLRLPSTIPAVFAGFYPQVWLYRALQGESQSQITEMWRKSLLDFKDYIGLVIRNPARRDAQLMLIENVINMGSRPMPRDRLGWKPLFSNCFALLVDMYDINFTTKADSLARKLEASFATGFVDIEESCRIVDVATTQELHEPTDTAGPTAAMMRVLASEVSALKDAAKRGRGGGRGSFRGGRGGRGGRGRGAL
jgi:hypothetical protein